MTVQEELLADLGRAVARTSDEYLLTLATACVTLVRESHHHQGQDVLRSLAAVIGSEQRDRDQLRRQQRRDQADMRVPQTWWGPPEIKDFPK